MSRARPTRRTGADAGAAQPATPPTALALRSAPAGTLLPVRVVPRAGRTGVDGAVEGALRVRLTAPPVEGAANAALIAYLADLLGLPKSAVTLAAGSTSRHKTLLLQGLAPAEVLDRVRRVMPSAPRT